MSIFSLELEQSFLEPSLQPVECPLNSPDDVKTLASLMQTGQFSEILRLNLPNISIESSQFNRETLETNIVTFLNENNSSTTSLLQMFCLGASSLQLFVQSNWLGCHWQHLDSSIKVESIEKELALDGECLIPSMKNLPCLLIAKVILHDLKHKFQSFKLSSWWMLRYLFVHQKVLEESSQILHSVLVNDVDIGFLEKELGENQMFKSLLYMELAYCYLHYKDLESAKQNFQTASQAVEFEIEWGGALGKRTYFQHNALPQLVVKIKHGLNIASDTMENDTTVFPKDLKLQDDTRLNKIAYSNKELMITPDLSPVFQALLIAKATQLEKFCLHDEFLSEELTPLLNCVLEHPKVWSFHFNSLVIRSRMESDQRRAVERSMMQMQELSDSLAKSEPPVQQRMKLFYVSALPLEWQLSGHLADVFHSLGAVNSALDIYVKLQMWEKVIMCYQQLEMKHRAEEIVRQELEKEETPKLWCLLGDCTGDVQHYEKAWEVSKFSSARAQRQWAMYFYRHKQLKECIPHFQKSLQINSLQEDVWLRLAFSAMELEQWDTAAQAYRRYCSLNSDSYEAWNNVAKCYVKLGQKSRAWRALTEAVKCQYDNWKVWDNLMVVSVDCGHFAEAVRSYNRIVDLKEKHVDLQVLRILVQVVAEKKEDAGGVQLPALTSKIFKLFGRLTSQVTNNAQAWEAYADLMFAVEEQASFQLVQTLQKAFRSAVQVKCWEKDVDSCLVTLALCQKFIKSCINLLSNERVKENIQLASSAKLSMVAAMSQVKRCYESEIPVKITEILCPVELDLTELTTLLVQKV